MTEIPKRVTLRENGTYIWSAEVDMESERKNYRTGGKICGIIVLVILLVGATVAILYHDWQVFLYFAGIASCYILGLTT